MRSSCGAGAARRRRRRCCSSFRAQQAPRAADAAALRRECALAAELSSASTLLPRLVESRQRTALVMEDPGGDLLSSARHAPRLPFDVVAAIGTQLAETLSELHARGIVHAGLRPAAVLCDTDTTTRLVD